MGDLHAAYLDTVADAGTSAVVVARNNFELRRQESACAKVSEGACSKGMAALLDKGTVERERDVAKAEGCAGPARPLHPDTGALTPAQSAELSSWLLKVAGTAYEATPEIMTHALTTAAKVSAPGPSGFRTSHVRRLLLEHEAHLKLFTTWTNSAFCSGSLPNALREAWAAARAIALSKPAGGTRPISMGDSMRRITGRAALALFKEEIQLRFRGKDYKDNLQLGCMTPNGSEMVVHDLSLHMQLHPRHTLLHLDVKNAFNTQHRFAFLKEVYTHFPALLPLCAQFYSHESDLRAHLGQGWQGPHPQVPLPTATR